MIHAPTRLPPPLAPSQLLYVTGRPTPDTRARFSDVTNAAANAAATTATASSAAEATTNSGDGGRAAPSNADTYDLVCCSLRMLEDAPLVDPELVGKGDEWTGGGDYLSMDLDEEAVTYVDSSRRLREMGKFLREVRSVGGFLGSFRGGFSWRGWGWGARARFFFGTQGEVLFLFCFVFALLEWFPAGKGSNGRGVVFVAFVLFGLFRFVVCAFFLLRFFVEWDRHPT